MKILNMSGNFFKNELHGNNCHLYNNEGQVIYKGDMILGFKEGYGKEYVYPRAHHTLEKHKRLVYSGYFENNEKTGSNCKIFRETDGSLEYNGSLKNGKRHGYGCYLYNNGKVMFKGKYCDDEPDDMQSFKIFFHENGMIYCQEDLMKNGVVVDKEFLPDGKPRDSQSYVSLDAINFSGDDIHRFGGDEEEEEDLQDSYEERLLQHEEITIGNSTGANSQV